MNKVIPLTEVSQYLKDGQTLMMGGFGLCGIPENLIKAVHQKGCKDLEIISNNGGIDEVGIGLLLAQNQVRKMISSYVGENKMLENLVLNQELDVELNPQGTLAERIRSGGAGVAAFYTPTGVGTLVAEGKETKEFDGRTYLLEETLWADVALIKAYQADKHGNLTYRKTARNFNSIMATAASFVIAEVEEIVEPGELDPDLIVTPSVYVDKIVLGENYEKRIEKRTNRPKGS